MLNVFKTHSMPSNYHEFPILAEDQQHQDAVKTKSDFLLLAMAMLWHVRDLRVGGQTSPISSVLPISNALLLILQQSASQSSNLLTPFCLGRDLKPLTTWLIAFSLKPHCFMIYQAMQMVAQLAQCQKIFHSFCFKILWNWSTVN